MSTPAIIYLVLTGIGLGVALKEHGNPKTGTHNAWVLIFASAPCWALLWWGGFFSASCAP